MAEDLSDFPANSREALAEALGLDPDQLTGRVRAAVEALFEEVIALREEVTRLGGALAEAELLADNDALCPVFNRRAFEREVRREIALAGRFGTPLSLIFIDLDNFKAVNDRFGHAMGDAVLLRVAEILKRNTRETDIVGRLGGDEFGVVLAQASASDSEAKARQLAEMIDALTVRDSQRESEDIFLGASCGVQQWQDGQSASDLIALGDQAMFVQKARRKGTGLVNR